MPVIVELDHHLSKVWGTANSFHGETLSFPAHCVNCFSKVDKSSIQFHVMFLEFLVSQWLKGRFSLVTSGMRLFISNWSNHTFLHRSCTRL